MNEQLIVKNFGPIKDATVDFKRVTVFIGPTGGGKSTLAKLAAILQGGQVKITNNILAIDEGLNQFGISNYKKQDSFIKWRKSSGNDFVIDKPVSLEVAINDSSFNGKDLEKLIDRIASGIDMPSHFEEVVRKAFKEAAINQFAGTYFNSESYAINYIPTERVFIPAVEYSWAGLMRDDIGLPKALLVFANDFSLSRKEIPELEIPFLNVKYLHIDGRDRIKIPDREEPLMLLEAASGIQSVTPLLVLLEHLSRNTEQAQSFIIEEPELNLFPLAQFELVKILVEKCAQTEGKNDLVLTTHSPYVLTALNLLCYAYRIAQQDEATAKKVAKLIPRHCWIDPDQFAAYYVDRPDTKRKQQVRSIINKKTGLIEENELDTASDELGSIFDKLVKLRKPTSTPARAN